MVGRFVEQQRVRRAQQHPRHRQPRALAARQHPHRLVDVVSGEEEAAEDVADARDHVDRRVAGERLVDGQRRIEPRRLVLREVLHHDLVPLGARAGVRRFDAREHPHQRRLAGAVRADQRDAIATLDVQVDAVEDARPP